MSGVRILILSFGMPSGTSLAAALWEAERDLKTPTTGFMVLSLSGRVLIGALGGVGNNQVFAAREVGSLGYYGGGFSEWHLSGSREWRGGRRWIMWQRSMGRRRRGIPLRCLRRWWLRRF